MNRFDRIGFCRANAHGFVKILSAILGGALCTSLACAVAFSFGPCHSHRWQDNASVSASVPVCVNWSVIRICCNSVSTPIRISFSLKSSHSSVIFVVVRPESGVFICPHGSLPTGLSKRPLLFVPLALFRIGHESPPRWEFIIRAITAHRYSSRLWELNQSSIRSALGARYGCAVIPSVGI